MSDKLNILTSNIIRFVAGERPTADKFNAMNQYYSRSIENICRAIGDMYGRSIDDPLSPKWNPHSTEDGRPLDMATIGRLIGPASNLNPKMFGSSSEIIEIFDADFINSNKELQLKYSIGVFGIFPIVAVKKIDTDGVESSFNLTSVFAGDINTYAIWKTKVIGFHSDLTLSPGETIKITYTTLTLNVEGGINYLNAGWNVIPDPNQNAKIRFAGTGLNGAGVLSLAGPATGYDYHINLTGYKITSQQSGATTLNVTGVQSRDDEYNQDKDFEFPTWYQGKFQEAGSAEITELPEGLVYLKDLISGEIYLTATYGYLNSKELYIKDANLCEDDDRDFCLILTGTDITTSIDDLRNKMFNHRHDGSFGEPFIRIQDLVGKFVTGEFGPSSIPGNEFPMYLHRKGYQTDTNTQNGNNAMLGDILMGNVLFDGISNTDIEGGLSNASSSHKVVFLNPETYIKKAAGYLVINNMDDRNSGQTDRTLLRTGDTLFLTQKYLDSNTEEDASFKQEQMRIISDEKTINAYSSLDYPQKEFSGRDVEINKQVRTDAETEAYALFNDISKLSKEVFKADRTIYSPKVKLTFQPKTSGLLETFPTPMANEETKIFNPNGTYYFSTPYSELIREVYDGDQDDYSAVRIDVLSSSIGLRRTIVHYLPYVESSFSFEYKKAKELTHADGFFDAGTWGPNTDVDIFAADLISIKAVNSYSDLATQVITFNSNVTNKSIASDSTNHFKSNPPLTGNDWAVPLYRSSLHTGLTDSTSYYFPDDDRPSYYPNSSQANASCIDISASLKSAMADADACDILINDQFFKFGINLIYGISFIDDDALSFDETLSHAVYLPYIQSNWGVKVTLKDSENRLGQGVNRSHTSWLKPFLRDENLSSYDEGNDFGNSYDYKVVNGREYSYEDYAGLTNAKLRHFARLEAQVNLNRLFTIPAENDTSESNNVNVLGSKIYELLASGDLKIELCWIGKSHEHPGIQYDFVGVYSESLDDSNDIDRDFNLAFANEGYSGTDPENKSAANCLISSTTNVTSSFELTQNGKAKTITNQIQGDWIGSNTQYLVFPRTYSDSLGEKQKWSFNTFQKDIDGKSYHAGKFAMHVQAGGISSPEFNSGYKIKEFIEFPNLILDFIEPTNQTVPNPDPDGEPTSQQVIIFRNLDEGYIDTHYLLRNNVTEMASYINEDAVTKIVTINGLEILSTKLETIDLSSLLKVYLFKETFIKKNYRFSFDGLNLKNWDILTYHSSFDPVSPRDVLDDAWSTWKGSTGGREDYHWYSEDYFSDNALYPDVKGTFRIPYDPEIFYDTEVVHKSAIYGVNFFFEVTEEMKNQNLMIINIDLIPSFTLLDSNKDGLE